MRIVFLGCVQFSYSALSLILNEGHHVVGVVMRDASSINADFQSLAPLAGRAGCDFLFAKGNNQGEMRDWISDRRPERHILLWLVLPARQRDAGGRSSRRYWLSSHSSTEESWPSSNHLGTRPRARRDWVNLLFHGRGRGFGGYIEPVINLHRWQRRRRQPLRESDFERAPADFRIHADVGQRKLQTDSAGWPAGDLLAQSTSKDGEIDWRMSARSVYNLVRALARPYVGAHCVAGSCDVKVWKCRPVRGFPPNVEPGKVLRVADKGIFVKCGEDAVELIEHEFPMPPREGDYL